MKSIPFRLFLSAHLLLLVFFLFACQSDEKTEALNQPTEDGDEGPCILGQKICAPDGTKVLQCDESFPDSPALQSCLECPSCFNGACLTPYEYCDYRPVSCTGEPVLDTLTLEPARFNECCRASLVEMCEDATICNDQIGCVADQGARCKLGQLACNAAGDALLHCEEYTEDNRVKTRWTEKRGCRCGCEVDECRAGDDGRCAYAFDACANEHAQKMRLVVGGASCCDLIITEVCAVDEYCHETRGCTDDIPDLPDGDEEQDTPPMPDGDDDATPVEDGDETEEEVEIVKSGQVFVMETAMNTTHRTSMQTAGVTASFTMMSEASETGELLAEIDECEIWHYPADGGESEAPKGLNAGRVTISGAAIDPIVLSPENLSDDPFDPNWIYQTEDTPPGTGNLFEGGEALAFNIRGGVDVPGISLNTTAIEPLEGVSPDPAADGMDLGTLMTASEITWQAGSGDIIITYTVGGGEMGSIAMTCVVADTGSYSLPWEEALEYFDPAIEPDIVHSNISQFSIARQATMTQSHYDTTFQIGTMSIRSLSLAGIK